MYGNIPGVFAREDHPAVCEEHLPSSLHVCDGQLTPEGFRLRDCGMEVIDVIVELALALVKPGPGSPRAAQSFQQAAAAEDC